MMDAPARPTANMPALRTIPFIDAPSGPVQLAELRAASLQPLLAIAKETLSATTIRWGDRLSRRWLARSASPYRRDVESVERLLQVPGAYVLNLNYEWACTTGCHPRDGLAAMTLYRTLDWPLRLGAEVVVARHETPHGPYLNVTWPGFVGLLTAVAKGRFAAAINQGPMTYSFDRFGLGLPIDWCVNRIRVWRQRALPPTHLLRQVFETCRTYAQAKERLLTTPVAAPVFFTLTGTHPGEGCIIERRENDAVLHEGANVTANHWLNDQFHGRPRPIHSLDRREKLLELMPRATETFDWLQPPILNRLTRLACEMNAGVGSLVAQGWDGTVPQTTILACDTDAGIRRP
ncbi:MAG TPA: hypothetical protein VM659_04870 [Dongiaceae bacterium]|nr:hypothetical protein [Dongiaceae bacterium]